MGSISINVSKKETGSRTYRTRNVPIVRKGQGLIKDFTGVGPRCRKTYFYHVTLCNEKKEKVMSACGCVGETPSRQGHISLSETLCTTGSSDYKKCEPTDRLPRLNSRDRLGCHKCF